MIRIIAKLFAVAAVLSAFLSAAPLSAQTVAWISSTGNNADPCTAAQPCGTFATAASLLSAGGQISCLNSPGIIAGVQVLDISLTIDCAGVLEPFPSVNGGILLNGSNQVVKIRNLTISGTGGGAAAFSGISVFGSGTLILENCVLENLAGGTALQIEPNGPFNLVVTNSRISNSVAGVLIKPNSGGSVTATFNGVTIADNTGGGLKTDTTNGPVRVDITASEITSNSGNGLNAVSGAGGAAMFNIHNSVIADNGSAGVQANGTNAAALIDATLLDSNVAGALAAIGSGRILTYGNNRIVGPAGSGFTGTASLQ
jgi:hypothetical protein